MWQDFKEIEDTERVEVEKAMENGPWKFQADSSLPGLTTPCVYTVYKNIMSIHQQINHMLKPVSLAMSWNDTEESYGRVSGLRFDLSLRCSSFQAQQGPNPQWSLAKRRVWARIQLTYENKKQSYRQTDTRCFFQKQGDGHQQSSSI